MASKLKIIPLGGLNEIGKNLTVYSYGKDMIAVDCGMGFPDEDMYGVDAVIPDISFLEQNKAHLRGIVLTHGHEDHIGALPYVVERLGVPIYGTRLTIGLVELKLKERDLAEKTKLITVEAGDKITLGCFNVELIHVNHSIADSVALAIRTPAGTIVHSGDFKIDLTPLQGEMTDLTRLGELGKEGVLALCCESTNAERPGYSETETRVYERLDGLFKDCEKRLIVTTFASNVHRIQQILTLAHKYRRRVAITGRSMENMVKLSVELGYMSVPENVLMEARQIVKLPPEKVVIICTGSQGESMSALYRMAFSEHKQIDVGPGDRVILSASAIPGNETTVTRVIDELFAKGAEVVYERGTDLHVSGHACQEELKMMEALTKPRFFIPMHGERHMLHKHTQLAKTMGIPEKNMVIGENGREIEISAKSIRLGDMVPSGSVLVDGLGVGDVGSVVLRDRRHLADEGMVVVVMTVSREDRSLISGPDIITRGFVYEKESDDLLDELKRVALEGLDSCLNRRTYDPAAIKSRVKADLSGYLFKVTKRNPMILPIITTV